MGKGQRHSKNAGVMGAESLSYAERKALGFGTVKERLGKVRAKTNTGAAGRDVATCMQAVNA